MNKIEDNRAKAIIAKNISRLLKEQNRSPASLAKSINEYRSTIANVCSGKHICGAGLLHRIAQTLGVKTDDLLKIQGKKRRKELDR